MIVTNDTCLCGAILFWNVKSKTIEYVGWLRNEYQALTLLNIISDKYKRNEAIFSYIFHRKCYRLFHVRLHCFLSSCEMSYK